MNKGEKGLLIWAWELRPPPILETLRQWSQTGISGASRIFVWPVKLWRFTWLPSIVLYTWPASGISVTCYASVRHLNL